jgi:hypothetical protein
MKPCWLFSCKNDLFFLKFVHSLKVVSISLELSVLLLNILSKSLLIF